MALRRRSRSLVLYNSSFNWLPGLKTSRFEAPTKRASKSFGHQRHLATTSADPTQASTPQQYHSSKIPPPPCPTDLDYVLQAVQSQDLHQIYKAFLMWTDTLANPNSPQYHAAVVQIKGLPAGTLSEILRNLDPLLWKKRDPTHRFHLANGLTEFTDASKLVDAYGVRNHHRQVLRGMQILMALNKERTISLTTGDYEVMLRCAGAAADFQASKDIWAAMPAVELQEHRTIRTWTEFIRSRFMTEPAYYQFDRARVVVLACDLYSNRSALQMRTVKRMDALRLSLNALKKDLRNRRRGEEGEDIRRLLRRRADYRAYRNHWIRALYWGYEVDEELICASIIAFSRSSSLQSIKMLVLGKFYGIKFEHTRDIENIEISGGFDLPPTSPLYPTTRLLDAIVEAFGAMSHIALGMKLLDFVSRRYNLPIPHHTWSNLLSWTYLCSSKPYRPLRRIHGNYHATQFYISDVIGVWDVMTAEPYNIKPSFEDYNVYIKAQLHIRSEAAFERTVSLIRSKILPFYHRVVADYEIAVQDEVLQIDLGPCPQATYRRNQAELYKDYVHHTIGFWFDRLLIWGSKRSRTRRGAFPHTIIPNLLLEFGDFFQPQIRYRSGLGKIKISRPEATQRYIWTKQWRTTLPMKKAGIYVRDIEGSGEAGFNYPRIQTMRVRDWRRIPKLRMTRLGPAPNDKVDDRKRKAWWQRLEEELML